MNLEIFFNQNHMFLSHRSQPHQISRYGWRRGSPRGFPSKFLFSLVSDQGIRAHESGAQNANFLQRHWLLINPRHLGWAATVALVALAFPKWENHHKWWKKTCSSLVSNGRIPFWGWISGGDQWRILHSDPYVLPTPNRYVATCSFLLFRCSEPLIAVPQVRQSHPMMFSISDIPTILAWSCPG